MNLLSAQSINEAISQFLIIQEHEILDSTGDVNEHVVCFNSLSYIITNYRLQLKDLENEKYESLSMCGYTDSIIEQIKRTEAARYNSKKQNPLFEYILIRLRMCHRLSIPRTNRIKRNI